MAGDPVLNKMVEAVQAASKAFDPLSGEERQRALQMFLTLLGHDSQGMGAGSPSQPPPPSGGAPIGSTNATGALQATARAFIAAKKPTSDVQRVTCIAYYMTHHDGRPSYKARDLAEVGTAAAVRFSNIRQTISNATRQNKFLIPAGPQLHQITPRGEAMVDALPDQHAAKLALEQHPIRTHKKRPGRPKKKASP
jgi:hypothetical protein